ncbi:MAG: hypothetical protein ACP5UN_00825 [Candidatus Micrarchaeia archaeon]
MFEIATEIIAMMITIGGIIYGIGYALDNRKIKEFAFKELTQSFINAAILFVLFSAFSQVGIITQVMNQVIGNLPSSILAFCGPIAYNYGLCTAYNYLVGPQPFYVGNLLVSPLSIQILNILSYLIPAYLLIGTVSTIGLSAIIISVKLTAFSIFLGPLKMAIEVLSTTLIALFIQATIINVIGIITPYLLYIGLTLRTFYFSRRLGGAILALAIGFFVVFPLTYLMNIEIMNSVTPYVSSTTLQSTLLNFSEGLVSFSINTELQIVDGSAATNSIISSVLNKKLDLPILNNIISESENAAITFEYIIKFIMDLLSDLILEIILLPLLSVILTIISIRELARILGSEISFGRFDLF